MIPLIAILAAKISSKLIKSLKLGKASALPGRVALAIYPKILEYYQTQLMGSELQFFITGTNGKTTTTGLLKQIVLEHLKLTNQAPALICNDYGANLYYGICTELVHSSTLISKPKSLFKKLPDARLANPEEPELTSASMRIPRGERNAADGTFRMGFKSSNYVLELDEAAFVSVAKVLQPKSVTVTNLFRDQLDRFGEIDSTQKLIVSGIEELVARSSVLGARHIILNADDTKVSDIKNLLQSKANLCRPEFYFYRVTHSQKAIENLDATATASVIANEDCFITEVIEEQIGYSQIRLKKGNDSIELKLNLPGLYNIYNACAAAATAYSNGISLAAIKSGLENYQCNFGRSEIKSINGQEYQVFLIKNPTGCTEVLKYINQDTQARYLIAINDNYADGRDVSWLWDARFDYINTGNRVIYCSGHRAEDMALRLKYAGINPELIIIEKNIRQALKLAASETKEQEHLYVLPTYTALLELVSV